MNEDITFNLHIPEIEEAVLGALLVDYKTSDIVLTNIVPDDFYSTENKEIYESCLRLYKSGIGIDVISVFEDLKRNSSKVDTTLLVDITNKVASTAHIEYHVQLLRDVSIRRAASHFGHKIIQEVADNNKSGKELMSEYMAEAEKILSRTNLKETKTFKERFIKVLQDSKENNGKPIGIPTGFVTLDSFTSGLCAPDFTVLAAGPGEGKSTLALNIAKNIGLNSGDVLLFTLEMKTEQLIYKLVSDETNNPVLNVRRGDLPHEFLNSCNYYNARLHVFDKGGMSIDELISISKYEAIEKNVKCIIVDYLQLLSVGMYAKKGHSRNDEVTIISRKLKELAMALNVPVIALSQVNRDKNRRTYMLPDLRESGAIEQDADNVWFIFRPTEHNMDTYKIGQEEINCDIETAILIIAKNRLGDTGQIEMKFKGQFSRFEDLNNNRAEEFDVPF